MFEIVVRMKKGVLNEAINGPLMSFLLVWGEREGERESERASERAREMMMMTGNSKGLGDSVRTMLRNTQVSVSA